jgi:hypothetical protein
MALRNRERPRGAARIEPIPPKLSSQGLADTEKGRGRFDWQCGSGKRHDVDLVKNHEARAGQRAAEPHFTALWPNRAGQWLVTASPNHRKNHHLPKQDAAFIPVNPKNETMRELSFPAMMTEFE